MEVKDIHKALRQMAGWVNVYIPEFTYQDLRIDAVIIDLRHRWIRGFEIKTTRQDFQSDYKWQSYSGFCSSLSIVCPAGLIQPEEITKPFGLLWLGGGGLNFYQWKKRPKKFNRRDSLAWFWTYLKVLEAEMPRLVAEKNTLLEALKRKKEG